MRPLSVCSETRLRPSFLRTIPARKPRTECGCHSVAATIAATVEPAGARNIAMMRACLVSGRAVVLRDEATAPAWGLELRDFPAPERGAFLVLDLALVIRSSEVARRHPPHHLRGSDDQGQ